MAIPLRISALIEHVLQEEERVAAAYVFGSMARGEATELSDIDLALVIGERFGTLERATIVRDLASAIARSAPGERFDIHDLKELPIAVAGRAVIEGTLVFQRDAAARVRAEVATQMAYHDFAWLEQSTLDEGIAGLRRKLGDG